MSGCRIVPGRYAAELNASVKFVALNATADSASSVHPSTINYITYYPIFVRGAVPLPALCPLNCSDRAPPVQLLQS